MAKDFKSIGVAGIGTSWTDIATSPAAKATVIISCNLANILDSGIQVDVRVYNSAAGAYYYLIKNAPLPVGASLQLIENSKVVLNGNDKIQVKSSQASSVDVVTSYMEDVNL